MSGHALLNAQTVEDCIIDQGWERYTPEDHAIWRVLFERQQRTLKGHVCQEYLDGLAALGIGPEGVPDFARMNQRLRRLTGWEVVAVPGLIPSRPFFQMLANRQFPAGTFIRSREQLDYLEEPDIFHDVFGHVPLLTNPAYADYMNEYGRIGLVAVETKGVRFLARLNWYTIEFGLIRKPEGIRIYGAGIVSSFGEARYVVSACCAPAITSTISRRAISSSTASSSCSSCSGAAISPAASMNCVPSRPTRPSKSCRRTWSSGKAAGISGAISRQRRRS
jgi:phenylalanine-4-hydroxylase